MKRINPKWLVACVFLLCAGSVFGQGKLLFTWHGAQNLFQASFQIYDFEMVSGTYFMDTGLFDRTVTATSPDHVWPATPDIGVANNEYGSRFEGEYLVLKVNLFDPALPDVRLLMFGASGSNFQDIEETRWSGYGPVGAPIYRETGYWTYAPVPEPSSVCLLMFGLLTLAARRSSNSTRS